MKYGWLGGVAECSLSSAAKGSDVPVDFFCFFGRAESRCINTHNNNNNNANNNSKSVSPHINKHRKIYVRYLK